MAACRRLTSPGKAAPGSESARESGESLLTTDHTEWSPPPIPPTGQYIGQCRDSRYDWAASTRTCRQAAGRNRQLPRVSRERPAPPATQLGHSPVPRDQSVLGKGRTLAEMESQVVIASWSHPRSLVRIIVLPYQCLPALSNPQLVRSRPWQMNRQLPARRRQNGRPPLWGCPWSWASFVDGQVHIRIDCPRLPNVAVLEPARTIPACCG